MSSGKITIYDVAKASGVSIATVSRVMNKPGKVNPETRAAVLAAIDELGFVPKAESRVRALRGTNRIGVLIPFFIAPSFVQRLRGIATVLSKANFEMVIFPVDSRSQMANYLEILPLNRSVDGLIIVSQTFDSVVAKRLIKNRLETVIIEYNNPNFCTVQINNEEGGYLAAKYLLKHGHKRFIFLGGSDKPEFGVDPITPRLEGFRKGLAEAGIDLPDSAVHLFITDTKSIIENTIQEIGYPIAIFAATDRQAFAVQKVARMLGLLIPQDIAVIGFDDVEMADIVGLTTVRQPLDESGIIAAELLLSRINDPSRSVQHIRLPLNIIERETV
jgi:DNA-binding LacI/PurR family transcriptional regulator